MMTKAPWRQRVMRVYSVMSGLGVNPLDRIQMRTVVGANHLFGLGALLCLPWTVIIAMADPPRTLAPAFTHLAMCSVWIACLELNRRRHHLMASVVGLSVALLQFTYLPMVFSAWSGFQLPLALAGALVFVVIPYRHWRIAIAVTALAAASVARTFVDPAFREPTVDVSAPWLAGVAIGNVVVLSVAMTGVGLLNHHFFMRERERNDLLLSEAEVAARTDSLTEVYNRRGVAPILSDAARSGQYSVALADLDRFKRINDSLGHGAGDVVLSNVARTLANAVGSRGVVARWGGEEFLVVLPGTTLAEATEHMERARRAVQEEYGAGGILQHVTMSIGVAHAPRFAGKEEVLRLADDKLYEAKASGRNTVVSASLADVHKE